MAKRKKPKADGPTIRERQVTWRVRHDSCMVCLIHYTTAYLERFPQPLQLHHIIGGSSKFDDEANWLMLCSTCHDHFHSGGRRFRDEQALPDLTLAHILWCKREADPDHWNPTLLQEKRGRTLPDPVELPAEFQKERARHGPFNPAG